jgi:hypothetical protein
MARKLDKLPEPEPRFKLPEKKPEEKKRILDALTASMVAESEIHEHVKRMRRSDPEPPPFWDVKVIGGSLKLEDVEAAIDAVSGPKEHRYRYPVRRPDRIYYHASDTLPPPGSSFTEQEVRFTDGDANVEVWEGAKMVCRIPVYALQAVLLNELLDAVS